jgi:hypothetical protein
MIKQILSIGLLVLAVQAYSAQAGPVPLGAPLAGIVREPDRTLRPVYGVAGNLITGQPLPLVDVVAASFSDKAGIVLSSGAIKLINLDGTEQASYSTAESNPVLGISQGPETAIAWLPSEEKLIHWTSAGFVAAQIDASRFAGPVVQVEMIVPAAVDLWLSIQSDSIQHIRVSLSSGAVTPLETVTGVNLPILVAGSSLIFYDTEGLEIQSSQRQSRALPLNLSQTERAGLTFESASATWIHISSSSSARQWMLHLGASGPSLCALPAVSSAQSSGVNQ